MKSSVNERKILRSSNNLNFDINHKLPNFQKNKKYIFTIDAYPS